jgi:hypothetical protein
VNATRVEPEGTAIDARSRTESLTTPSGMPRRVWEMVGAARFRALGADRSPQFAHDSAGREETRGHDKRCDHSS